MFLFARYSQHRLGSAHAKISRFHQVYHSSKLCASLSTSTMFCTVCNETANGLSAVGALDSLPTFISIRLAFTPVPYECYQMFTLIMIYGEEIQLPCAGSWTQWIPACSRSSIQVVDGRTIQSGSIIRKHVHLTDELFRCGVVKRRESRCCCERRISLVIN